MKKILAIATAALMAMSTIAQAAQISYDDGTLNITTDESVRADFIQAVYDDEGRLIKADRKSVSAPYSKEFEPEIGKNNKLMFWNSIGEMEPLAIEPEEVFIESVVREGITECYPYQLTETTAYQRKLNEKFTMSGVQYTDGFVMKTYTDTAFALFNLDKEYKEVSFVAGHVDSTSNRDKTLNIYLDRVLVEQIPLNYADTPQTVTVNTEGASGMKLEIEGMYDSAYGFADFKYVYTGENIKPDIDYNWMEVFAPYQYNNTTKYSRKLNEKFTMSGDEWTDGFVMETYTDVAEAQFNLEGKCEELTFTVGHIDYTSNRNNTLNVYLDRVLMESIPLYYDGVAKEYTISLRNVDGDPAQHLKLQIDKMYDSAYGFTNGYFEYTDEPEKRVADSNWMEVFTPYQYNNTTKYSRKLNEKFTMSGYEYTDGFVMETYTDVAEVQFNLAGKCEELTFTVGHIDNTSNRNNTLNVYLDRVLMYEIPLYYDDVAREHTISLENIDGELAQHLKFSVKGLYDAAYGFTYGYFDYTSASYDVNTTSTWLTECAPLGYDNIKLYSKKDNTYFTMSGDEYTDGIVMENYVATSRAEWETNGKYEALKVTIGHIDNTSNRENTLSVYLDDVLMEEIPLYYDDVAREHTISLKNVDGKNASRLKLEIKGMYDAAYGLAGGEFIEG